MRNVPLLAVLVLAGCIDDDSPELGSTEEALTSPGAIVRRDDGDPATPECTLTDVSEDQFAAFANVTLPDVLGKARIVANSPAYQSCIRTAMTIGKPISAGRNDSLLVGTVEDFGPYFLLGSDLGFYATKRMSNARIRDLYAARVLSESLSPHAVDITCQPSQGGAAGVPNPTFDRARPELMRLSSAYFNHDASQVPANLAFRAGLASIIWHEAMHERGYAHDTSGPIIYRRSVPVIAGACMEDVFARSEAFCSNLQPCRDGRMVIKDQSSTTCSCVSDPASVMPTLKQSWNLPGVTQMAVDNAGTGFVLAAGSVLQRQGSSWLPIGQGDALAAGADMVAWRDTSANRWRIKPRTGPMELEAAESGNGSRTIDGFGSLIRTTYTAGRVQRRLPNLSGWQELGFGMNVIAGSDLLFKTDNANKLYRYSESSGSWSTQIGDPGVGLAMDTYGTLYHLSLDLSTILKNRGGAVWEWVGGQDTAIGAGDTFFARSINGWVYRRAPTGWQQVAQCDSFATGARTMYCVRGSTIEEYGY